MAQHDHDPVLVTGCSTGIGRAVVEDLLRQGHTVWATARRPDTLADLADRGAHVTALDVTDEASMVGGGRRGRGGARLGRHPGQQRRLRRVRRGRGGRPGQGAGDVRDQRLRPGPDVPARAAGDAPRRDGAGSSTSARWAGGSPSPSGGYYHATKYAVEALTDALRMEVKAFGVDVALVEPGVTRSEFVEKTTDSEGMGGAARLPLRRDAGVGVDGRTTRPTPTG